MLRAWMLVILLSLVAGCATSGASTAAGSAETRPAEGPRVRCLGDASRETSGTRPLFFFFCMESP